MGQIITDAKQAPRKPRDIRHLKKTFGGRSAVEVHRELAFPPTAKCQMCPNRPAVRAIVMAPLDEAQKMGMLDGITLEKAAALEKAMVDIRHPSGAVEKFLRLSVTYSCVTCRSEMEKALAKQPSWCIVEINEGPPPEKIIA